MLFSALQIHFACTPKGWTCAQIHMVKRCHTSDNLHIHNV